MLTGLGYGRELPQHHTGWFQWDTDARNALDPSEVSGSRTTKVTFDFTSTPSTIDVDQQAAVPSARRVLTARPHRLDHGKWIV